MSDIHQVEDNILDDYISLWKEYSAPKRHIMTAPGQTEKYCYYVKEGIQKSYSMVNDKQHIIAFAYAPSLSGVPDSFFTQTPSKFFLETITASQFLRISYQAHDKFMQENREIETLFRKALELFLVGEIQRHHELLAHGMEKRFTDFVKRSPHLLQLIPQKDLASYLKIDSTNFSKLINSIRI